MLNRSPELYEILTLLLGKSTHLNRSPELKEILALLLGKSTHQNGLIEEAAI